MIGIIQFQGEDDGSNVTAYATIQAQIADVTGGTEDGTLKLQTMVAGTVTTGLAIAGGNVGIGTSSPSQPLHVDATGGTTAALFDNNGTNGDVVRVAKNGTDVLKFGLKGQQILH